MNVTSKSQYRRFEITLVSNPGRNLTNFVTILQLRQ